MTKAAKKMECPHCGAIVPRQGVHVGICAIKTNEERAYYLRHRVWPRIRQA